MSTIFKQIIDGKLPSTKVYEDEYVLAIDDIHPIAPVHILIMPKKEIPSLQEVEEKDLFLISHMIKVAQKLAVEKGIEDGYRLLTNNGPDGGQVIFHLHFHLIGGRVLGHMG